MGTAELNKALAAFQAEIPKVAKRLTADMGTFKSDYAPLEDVTDAAMPLLGKHGLALTAFFDVNAEGRQVLAYALLHESGEERTGVYLLPERVSSQAMGSALTYARRQILGAATGIAPAGEDDDGKEAEQAKPPPRQRPQRPPSRPTADPVRTAVTGPEHERLRHGTVEPTPDDRPAERNRRPLPDDANPWQGKLPEELPGSADPKDIHAIQAAYHAKLGFKSSDRNQILATTQQLIGRQLDTGPNSGRTHNNLTWHEAKKLRGELEGFGDRAALVAHLAEVMQGTIAVAAHAAAEATQEEGTDD